MATKEDAQQKLIDAIDSAAGNPLTNSESIRDLAVAWAALATGPAATGGGIRSRDW